MFYTVAGSSKSHRFRDCRHLRRIANKSSPIERTETAQGDVCLDCQRQQAKEITIRYTIDDDDTMIQDTFASFRHVFMFLQEQQGKRVVTLHHCQ